MGLGTFQSNQSGKNVSPARPPKNAIALARSFRAAVSESKNSDGSFSAYNTKQGGPFWQDRASQIDTLWGMCA
jgi:hypothetical protein